MRYLHSLLALSVALGLGLSVAARPAPAAGAAGDASPLPVDTPWSQVQDASPAFTPDGRAVIFTCGRGESRHLYVSHQQGRTWSTPQLVSFSHRWMDIEPAMAPDGSYLIFASNRPADMDGNALDGHFEGKPQPMRGANLWRVDRIGDHWGTPVRLPNIINAGSSIYAPSVATDGSVYFMKPDPQTDHFRLYVSHFAHGGFAAPQPLPFGDGTTSDADPAISPDQSFLVFTSDRKPAPSGRDDLFLVHATSTGWGAPVHLGPSGYDSRLDPGLANVYFTAADHHLERMPIARWLARPNASTQDAAYR